MIEARKERARELILSLKSVKVRSQTRGEEESAFEGTSSSLTETGAGKNDAAHSGAKLATTSLSVTTDMSRLRQPPGRPIV